MGSAVIAAGGFAAFAAAGGSLFAAFALGAGLSLVSRALMAKPDVGAQMGGQSVMTREAASSRKIIYGRARIGGNVVYLESTGSDNKYLYLVIAVAGHEIDAYESVWFGDEKIWDGTNYLNNWGSVTSISFYKGDQTAADSGLVSASNKWTADHKLLDTAYMVVRLEHDVDKFSNGLPNISTIIRGKKVLDPSDNSTAWSQNPALCIYDYLRDTKYGLSETAANILTASVTTAKGVCDEAITLSAGGTQPRYTIDGVVDTNTSIKTNIETMVSSMAGRLVYSGGKFEVHAGEYIAPSITVDESQIIGEITVQTKQSRRNAFNGVKGIFLSEEDNYILADYPAQISSAYAVQDGDPIYLDMPLPYTSNNIRAQRLAKLALFRSRQQEAITIPCNLSALRFKIGDNISVTNTRLGYNGKVFEVVGYAMDFTSDGQIVVNVDAIETASSIWDWQASDEEVFLGGGEVVLYDGSVSVAPASISVVAVAYINADGTTNSTFDVTWPTAVDAFTDHYLVEWRLASPANQPYFSQATKLSPFTISNLANSATYNVRVKAVNELGVTSSPVTTSPVSVIDTTAPNAPTSVSAKDEFEQATISWVNPTANDFNHVRIYGSNSATSGFAEIGRSAGTTFTEPELGTGVTRHYKLKAFDDTENASVYSSVDSATTTQVPIGGIADDAVDTDQIADLAVHTDQLDTNAVTIAKIAASLQSTNYVSGSAGWKILKSGVVEFEEATIRGSIIANDGEIGGFDIAGTYLKDAANTMGLSSVASSADDVRFWAGNTFANRATAPFFVTKGGALKATKITVSGTAPLISIGTNSADTITLSTASDYRMWVGSSTPENAKFSVHKDGTLTAKGMHLQDGSANAYFSPQGFTDLAYSEIAANTASRVSKFESNLVYNLQSVKVTLIQSTSLTLGIKASNLFSGLDLSSVTIGSAQSMANALADIPDNFTLKIQKSTTSAGAGFTDVVSQAYTKVTTGSSSATNYRATSAYFVPSGTTTFATPAEIDVSNHASVTGLDENGDRTLENTATYAQDIFWFRVQLTTTDTSYDTSLNNLATWPRSFLVEDNGSTGFNVISANEITQAAASGDITGVEAGTNLNGGGASGDVILNLDSTIIGDHTFEDNLTIEGNLTVQGTTTTVDTDDLNVKDKNITLNYSTGDSSANANGAGITIQDAVNSTTNATILWDSTNDKFDFSHKLTTPSLDVGGAIEFNSLSGTGSVSITDILDQDNMSSNSATALATQQSIKAYVLANVNSGSFLPLSGGILTGNVLFADSGTTKRGIQGQTGTNDYWFVGGGATASNSGYMEISAGDDGTTAGSYEPIYVRQYLGTPLTGTVQRTLTLLDNNGNTAIPNTLTVGTIDSGGITSTGSTSVDLSSINIGFVAPNGEIKSKNTSANPASNLDFFTTNSTGNTLLAMRVTSDRDLSIGRNLAMNGTLDGVSTITANSYKVGSQEVITSGRALTNLSGITTTSGSITSYGSIKAGQGGVYTNSIERITNAGNLTNIGTISSGTQTIFETSSSLLGLNLVGNVSSANQNSSSPKVRFNGEYQVNGPFIQAVNSASYGLKTLNFNTKRSANDYTTLPTTTLALYSSGNVNVVSGALEVGGQTVIDASRNLTNIGTISSGITTISGAPTDTNGLLTVSNTHANGGIYYPAARFVNVRSNHSYGIVAEFRTDGVVGTDRPSILFTTDLSSHTWQVGSGTSPSSVVDDFVIGYRGSSNDPNTFPVWSTPFLTINHTTGNATFAGTINSGAITSSGVIYGTEFDLPSGAMLDWANGDARIVEGLVNNYSLSFQTYDGSTASTALRLDGNNAATFAGSITAAGIAAGSVSSTAGSITSYGALYAGQGGVYTNSVERITNAGNLTNIGTISSGAITAPSFSGASFGAASGAPDSTIWAISRDTYPTYGIFYVQGSPDKINYKWNGATKFNINMETGALDTPSTITGSAFYGDGSNLTGVSSTTINSNADNRIITGSGTANTLNAESGLTYDGTTLSGNAIQMSGNINASQVSANNVVGNVYKIGATTVINSSRNATFASVLASTVQANATTDVTGVSLRSTYEVLSGESWCTALYNYNENDGFLVLRRSSTSGTAYPHFHVSGYNNPGYAGYTNGDGMVTITRSTGTKTGGSTYAGSALSTGTDFSRWVKTTTETILYDNDSQHRITGRLTVNGSSANTTYPLHVTGTIASTTGYAVGTTTVIDASRNATFVNGSIVDALVGPIASGNVYDTVGTGSLYFGSSASNAYSIKSGALENIGGNYTKLHINWHTGIKIGAAYNYGGIRFYNNSLDGYTPNMLFSIGNTDQHVRATNNFYSGGEIHATTSLTAPLYKVGTNTVIDASRNATFVNLNGAAVSSYWVNSGSWYGDLGSNGYTRQWGLTMTGGSEFVVLSKNGQGSLLVDGQYMSYETSNGFFGSFNSSYGNLTGIRATAANTLTVMQLDGGSANLVSTGSVSGSSVSSTAGSITSYGALYAGQGGIYTNSVQRISNAGNLTNIGTITSGNIVAPKYYLGSSSSNYGVGIVNASSARFDTVDSGQANDPLELCYYSGNGVRIGPNGGDQYLSAGSIQITGTTVIDSSRVVQNVTLGHSNTGARFETNDWIHDSGGNRRFFFSAASTTYFGSGAGWVFRDSADAGRATISNYGGLNVLSGGDGQVGSTVALAVSGTTVIDASRNAFPQSVQFPSNDGGISTSLQDGALQVRAHADKFHKIWYYDGIAFATNEAHGHFRFYAESNTQRNSTTGGKTLIFDIDSQNKTVGSLGSFKISGSHSSSINTPNINSYGALSAGTAYNYHMVIRQGDGTVRGQITNNVYGTQYTGASDYRLKENIQPLPSATSRTLALNPCTFNWIDDADNTLIQGFVAHEVAAIVPEAVVGEKDAIDADGNPHYQTIDQSKLIPILVKTIQELEARITALESA